MFGKGFRPSRPRVSSLVNLAEWSGLLDCCKGWDITVWIAVSALVPFAKVDSGYCTALTTNRVPFFWHDLNQFDWLVRASQVCWYLAIGGRSIMSAVHSPQSLTSWAKTMYFTCSSVSSFHTFSNPDSTHVMRESSHVARPLKTPSPPLQSLVSVNSPFSRSKVFTVPFLRPVKSWKGKGLGEICEEIIRPLHNKSFHLGENH